MSVNHEVKGTLAKLLATENLIIEHKKVPTASFDVLRRVLTLPIWDRASSVVYDLLVGHEVGHALYTPNEDWTTKVPDDVPKDFVNVVEDARIEKMMKRKFPGLARTFYNGYKELNDDDFFSIADEDVENLSLIDRINLHFKIGAYARMPFNERESAFIEMIEQAETFDQVLYICEELQRYIKQEAQESMNLPSNQEGVAGSGQGNQGESEEQVQVSGNGTQTEGGQGGSGPNESEPQEKSDSNTPSGSKGSGPNDSTADGAEGGGPNESTDQQTSKTQQAFDQKAQSLANTYGQETYYVERPQLDMKHVIADYKMLLDYMNESYKESARKYSNYGTGDTLFKKVDADYRKYKAESQKEVNYLVKEFEMKKSADAYQRMSTARTGTLDTSKLHTYKYNEDIFRKISVVPDGKNHGLVFILDWSGSMSDYLLDTVKQLLNLVWFCKKVQIPFEVYGFTYEWSNSYVDGNYNRPSQLHKREDGTLEVHNRFRLLNFLSSRANSKVLDQCILNLWRLACREDSHYYMTNSFSIPSGLDLSGTPLNESIIALHQIIPDFQANNKLQKVNVVILTDGEGNNLNYNVNLKNRHGSSYNYLGQNYVSNINALRDRKIGHVYRNFDFGSSNNDMTAILLENLKDNFPQVNLIGFRIMGGGGFYHLTKNFTKEEHGQDASDLMKVWKKERSCEINGVGYDALYVVASNNLSAGTVTMTVEQEATTADIGKAFRTMLKKKTTNKKLLSSFATLVA
jgi:hypothetical protein